jgi:uncharacterized membrane protein
MILIIGLLVTIHRSYRRISCYLSLALFGIGLLKQVDAISRSITIYNATISSFCCFGYLNMVPGTGKTERHY